MEYTVKRGLYYSLSTNSKMCDRDLLYVSLFIN